jgi:hypothetical protein
MKGASRTDTTQDDLRKPNRCAGPRPPARLAQLITAAGVVAVVAAPPERDIASIACGTAWTVPSSQGRGSAVNRTL